MTTPHEVYKPQQSLSIASREWWEWLLAMGVFALSLALIGRSLPGVGSLLLSGGAGYISWVICDLLRLAFPAGGLYWFALHLGTAHHYHPVPDPHPYPPLLEEPT